MNSVIRTLLGLAVAMTVGIAFAPLSPAAELDCQECHEDLTAGSVHDGAAECQECHEDVRDESHENGAGPVDCGMCHDELAESAERDIHRRLHDRVGANAPNCERCHGTHDIRPVAESKDPVRTYCAECHDNVLLVNPYHSLGSVDDATCLECHVEAEGFPRQIAGSVHQSLGCSDCHAYSAKYLEEHQDATPFDQVADCYLCHKPEALAHRDSIHGISIAAGINEAANCWNCHGSHAIVPAQASDSPVHPTQLAQTCGACHDDPQFAERFSMSVKRPGTMYSHSVHGELVKKGRMEAANCVLCHGVHDIKNRVQPGSTITPFAVPDTCGACHPEIAAEYKRSIHWARAKRGVKDGPVCNDCHSEHSIQGIHVAQQNGNQARLIQEETCVRCHSDPIIARRYNLNPNRAESYRDSYHGLAERRGDMKVAMCVDCHGVHEILPRVHPNSLVNESRVVETCSRCHPNANAAFAHSYTHEKASPRNRLIEYWVRLGYLWAIWLIVGAMLLHNALIYGAELRGSWRRHARSIGVPRFARNEAIQHALLMTSFVVLAITGFALTYPEAWFFRWLEWLQLTEAVRQWIHRGAGVVIISLGLYHLGYLVATQRGRQITRALWPAVGDLRALGANLAFYLGLRKERPEFDEFDYAEKAEYWALLWGTLVMAVTGVILWFPENLGQQAPSWVIPVSTIVHFYEAVLATLAIVIWHGFFVMMHPRQYPLNFTMVNGRMELQAYAHHHRRPFKQALLEWTLVRSGRLERGAVSIYTERIVAALEREGHDVDAVLQGFLDREHDLRAWLEQRLLER